MKCEDINQTIYDYCEDTLSPDLHLEFTQHLKDCVSCRNNYRLTLIENEVLCNTNDIPSLSDSFTSVVISSLSSINNQSSKPQPIMNRNKGSASSRALWYSCLAVSAAIIALCIYISQWYNLNSKINVANNNSVRLQESHAIALINPISSNKINTQTNSEPTVQIKSEVPIEADSSKTDLITDDFISRLSISSSHLSSNGKISTSLPNGQAKNPKPGINILAISPLNIPNSFKLVKTTKAGDKKNIYDYISLDGKKNFQLVVVNSNKHTFVINSLNHTLQLKNSTVIRIVQMQDIKITATFSGNLSTEELTNIANGIQFKVDDTK